MPRYAEAADEPVIDWKAQAACDGAILQDPFLQSAWITENNADEKEATAICVSCKVRMQCLFDALRDGESYGLRGGFFFDRGALTRADAERLVKEFGIRPKVRQRLRKSKDEVA